MRNKIMRSYRLSEDTIHRIRDLQKKYLFRSDTEIIERSIEMMELLELHKVNCIRLLDGTFLFFTEKKDPFN